MPNNNRKEKFLVMKNELARMPFKEFSLAENKLTAMVSAKLQYNISNLDWWETQAMSLYDFEERTRRFEDSLLRVELSFAEMKELIETGKQAKTHYLETAKGLQKKTWFQYALPDGSVVSAVLFPYVRVDSKNKKIIIKIQPSVYQDWLYGKEQFSKVYLDYILSFKSNHAYLIYCDLLSRCAKTGKQYRWFFSTKKLKNLLNLTKDSYTDIQKGKQHFNRNRFEKICILNPLKEIREKTNLDVYVRKVVEETSAGPRVSGYEFICTKWANNLPRKNNPPENTMEYDLEHNYRRKKKDTEEDWVGLFGEDSELAERVRKSDYYPEQDEVQAITNPTEQDRRDVAKLNQADYAPLSAMSDPAPENDFSSFAKPDYEEEEYAYEEE